MICIIVWYIIMASKIMVEIFTKAINAIIRIITWDMVMMVGITIRFIIMARNSIITIRICIWDTLHYLGLFVQFRELVKYPWRSDTSSKVVG